jgi:GT2 family glycosyltransferase
VLGRARWIGLAPGDLQSLEILTVSDPAAVRVDNVQALSGWQIVREIMLHRPSAVFRYLYSLAAEPRSRAVLVRSLLDLSPTEQFDDFERLRTRAFEPSGIDAALPKLDPIEPSVSFIIITGSWETDHVALDRTLRSLAEQIDPGFGLVIGNQSGGDEQELRELLTREGLATRTELIELQPDLRAESAGLDLACRSRSEWVARLDPGDVLSAESVLVLRDWIATNPELRVLYADSLASGGEQKSRRPELKPDWSPAFLGQIDYVGRPCLFRRSILEEAAGATDLTAAHPWWNALKIAGRGRDRVEIGHLRRILLERSNEDAGLEPTPARLPAPVLGRPARLTTIIIPTRDRVELLRRAITSIVHHAGDRDGYEILIIDNDSAQTETLEYLSSIADGRRVRVLRCPGPFNYPELVNAGAEAAAGDVVLLLNNDCEAQDGTWLGAMTSLAKEADVGAVGAILLYEDGRLQHAGVALGLGGEAGHRDRKMPADHPGNLRRLTGVHEVSAVTAACLAVERRKYLEVGGFDRAFAVAFNDIDFCLRLQERGYRNLLTPHAVLIHAESASRGQDTGPKRTRFEREAALFRDRWRPLIHDDPYFHPLFSTTRFNDRLG